MRGVRIVEVLFVRAPRSCTAPADGRCFRFQAVYRAQLATFSTQSESRRHWRVAASHHSVTSTSLDAIYLLSDSYISPSCCLTKKRYSALSSRSYRVTTRAVQRTPAFELQRLATP